MSADRRLVLAVDTSTTVNVGLAVGSEVLATARVTDRMAHAEQLMPLVARCFVAAGVDRAELGLIVVGLGPGPFTGLRVGVATAHVLGMALGIPVRGVCSLDAIAAQHVAARRADPERAALADGEFVVVTDARRRELYWARYTAQGIRLGEPQVSSPDGLPGLASVGPAAELYPQLAAARGPRELDPGLLAVHGPDLPDLGREPLYLRRPDATEPGKRKSVLRHAAPLSLDRHRGRP